MIDQIVRQQCDDHSVDDETLHVPQRIDHNEHENRSDITNSVTYSDTHYRHSNLNDVEEEKRRRSESEIDEEAR